MKVFFSCATTDLLKYKDSYLKIVDTIKQGGHSITRDWLNREVMHLEMKDSKGKRSDLYTKVMSAITQADVVIFDCTVRSMGLGHQLTYALDKGKPTLLLSKGNSMDIKDLFISGSKSGFLTIRNYKDIKDIPEIVNNFLLKNSSRPKVRFQIVLDKEQNDFIEWASYIYKRNKSEIIKSAIDKSAQEDNNYINFSKNL